MAMGRESGEAVKACICKADSLRTLSLVSLLLVTGGDLVVSVGLLVEACRVRVFSVAEVGGDELLSLMDSPEEDAPSLAPIASAITAPFGLSAASSSRSRSFLAVSSFRCATVVSGVEAVTSREGKGHIGGDADGEGSFIESFRV